MPASPLLLSALLSVAWASPTRNALDSTMAATPDTTRLAFACSPLDKAFEFLGGSGLEPDGGPMSLEQARALLSAGNGVDPDGTMAMVMGAGNTMTLRMGFSGTTEEAIELMSVELPDASGPDSAQDNGPQALVVDDVPWKQAGNTATRAKPDRTETLELHDGVLSYQVMPSRFTPTDPPSTAQLGPLLDTLPDRDGCAVYMNMNGAADAPPSIPAAVRRPFAFFVPFDLDAPIQLAMALPPSRGRELGAEPVAPVALRSPTKPMAVITLGTPPLQMLRDPVIQSLLPAQVRSQLPASGPFDHVGAGLTVGVFMGMNGLQIMGALPVTTEGGRSVSGRRLMREVLQASRDSDFAIQRVGRRTLQFNTPSGRPVFMEVQRGRVLFGTDLAELQGMIDEVGQPWLSAEDRAYASRHAVHVTGDLPLPMIAQTMSVQLGAGTTDNVFMLELATTPSLLDPRLRALMETVGDRVPKDGLDL